MKKLMYLTLSLTLLLTSFTLTTNAANYNYDPPVLQSSYNNVDYGYRVASDSRLILYMECLDDVKRNLKFKVKFYDFDGYYITTYEDSSRRSTYLSNDFYRSNWLTAKVYYYIDDKLQTTKSVHR